MLLRRRLWRSFEPPSCESAERRSSPASLSDAFDSTLASQPGYLVPERLLGEAEDTPIDGFFESAALDRRAAAGAADFRARGYVAVERIIHPLHLGALRIHTRRLLRTGAMKLGDSGDPRRYVAHNEPIARRFHERLTGVVARIAGVPVKPSYVYIAAYQGGAELRAHTDRPQCEYSISLLVDFTPEPVGESPWPLLLDTEEGTVAIHQRLGDALVYRGRRFPHRRARLSSEMTSTSILFHYVDVDFSGSLD